MAERQVRAGCDGQTSWFGQALRSVAFALIAIMLAPAAGGAQPAEPSPSAEAAMPEILRGSVAAPPKRIEPALGPSSDSLDGQALAGDRFWMVNEERGKLVACRLVNTSQVGGQYIRCAERRLPRSARPRD